VELAISASQATGILDFEYIGLYLKSPRQVTVPLHLGSHEWVSMDGKGLVDAKMRFTTAPPLDSYSMKWSYSLKIQLLPSEIS
jgi:hypothetical protein